MAVLKDTFTATGTSAVPKLGRPGDYNVSIRPTGVSTFSVNLERSFDNGSTWGVVNTFTQASTNMETIGTEAESCMLYRWNCTAISGGTLVCRFGTQR